MRHIFYIALLIQVLVSSGSFAQDSVSHRALKINAIGAYGIVGSFQKHQLGSSDFQTMAPNNVLLQNYKGLNNSKDLFNDQNLIDIGASVGILFKKKDKAEFNDRMILRTGIFYNQNKLDNLEQNGTYRSPCDTLYSQNTSAVYHVDTVKQYSYSFYRTEDNIGVFLENTFHTDQQKFVSFYTGYGFQYCFNITNTLNSQLDYSETFTDEYGKNY